MNPILALLLSAMVKGTDIESGLAALVKLSSGLGLTEADHTAIGRAMELAHRRMEAGKAPSPPPSPPSPPPSGLTLPPGLSLGTKPAVG